MAVKVKIPTPLRNLTQDQDTVTADGGTLGSVVETLEGQFPGMRERLLDEGGEIRRFVNIYVNGEDVRFLSGLTTDLKDGDEVSIVPAVAGGSR
ncbi:MAG: MoaD/ThiS family protein [Dehalococcoidia bacterium]|nr:MoaD/ThiS family protein [Dehalococcoidia bacterium]